MIEENNKEALELEKGVLGAILLEEYAIEVVEGDLKPDLFTDPANQDICKAILEVRKDKGRIDILSISQKIKAMGKLDAVGGSFYISSLTNRIASSANLEYHLKLLQQLFLVRETIRICQYGVVKGNEFASDGFELIAELTKKFEKAVNELVSSREFDTIEKVGTEFVQNIEAVRTGVVPPSLTTGLTDLNEAGGFYNSDLIILAARPGMGKTALALKFVRNCVLGLKEACGVFSIEMSTMQLLTRIASAECEIDSERIRMAKNLTNSEMNAIHAKIGELKATPLYIDPTAAINIDLLCMKARRMKRLFNIKLLVIDYMQLITTSEYRNDKRLQVGYISNRLKQLAKELDIPIIALSQLSRSVDSRAQDKLMPVLADLRESGDIEQDADQIYFILRPDYYDLSTYMIGGTETPTRGKAIISAAKNRHGSLITILAKFIGQYTDFRDNNSDIQQLKIKTEDDLPF